MKATDTDSSKTKANTLRALWLNPRRKRFWGIFMFLAYTLAGFFLVPYLVKNEIIDLIQEDLGRTASIEKVQVNPFKLNLRIFGFSLQDTDGERLLAFDQFHANLQLSSIYHRAWTFDEISLTGPYLLFERYTIETTRLGHLLADMPAPEESREEAESSRSLPRLLIHQLAIREGHGLLKDNLPLNSVELPLGPINVEIQQLNTLPGLDGRQTVSIALPGDAKLSWQGILNLAPLESSGSLVLENSNLDQTIAYLEEAFPLDHITATLSARLDYRLQADASGELAIELSNMQAELENLQVAGLSPPEEFVGVRKISVEGGNLRYPEQVIHFDRIQVDEPALVVWLDEQGIPSLNQLIPLPATTDSPDGNTTAAAPWAIKVDEIALAHGRVDVADRRFDPAAAVGFRQLQFSLNQFTTDSGANFPFSFSGALDPSGEFNAEGQLAILPSLVIKASASSRSIPLAIGQPYIAELAYLLIESGDLSSQLELSVNPGPDLTVEGSLAIANLDIRDTRDDTDLMSWKHMEIDRFELQSSGPELHLSQVLFEEPYGRLMIKEDLSTNLTGLMRVGVEPAPEQEATPEPETNTLTLVIGGTGIRNGSLDFSDFSLPLPFTTKISNLDGTLSTIATNSIEPANIRLEGQVDEFGMARINGTMNLLDPIAHTDTQVEFRNLLMSNLSPYSVQFAGREIDEGKLDLDLSYVIKEGQLAGENEVVLSQLVLGQEVDSPGAVSLPLGLAVALLTDSEGIININLPVTGDFNDPEFRIGGVIWKAFSGLITKIVTAPFRLLGNLIGVDSEDLGQFQFLPGRTDLTPPELEKVGQLQQALAERPELVIEVNGVIDPDIDTEALKYFSLRKTVIERLEREPEAGDDDFMMLDQDIRETLEALFTERFPAIPLDSIRNEHMQQASEDPDAEIELDQLAFAADLRDRLLEAEPVSADDLAGLGRARAETIQGAFLADGQFPPERIIIADTVEVESEDSDWVVSELGVAAD